jgi:Carboxypeptidase regulatory-like domain
MSSFLKYLAVVCLCWIVAAVKVSSDSPAAGFLEGHLKIVSPKEVELAEPTPSESTASNYSDYALIILSKDGKTDVTHVTPDSSGKYRVALPPGEYTLDVQGRRPKGHLRATPQPFTISANQTVRVDMTIDTGVR